jgi:CRP-like cAMP-binding protein
MTERASTNLFAGISKSQIAGIVRLSQSRDFAHSETVVRVSEAANRFFLIKAGCVDYFIHTPDGREVLLRRLVRDEVFGFGAFFSVPMGYLGTAVASRRSTLLVWSRHSIRAISRNYPKFVENALRIACHYFEIYIQRHARLVSKSAQERLALCLLNLGARVGNRLADGVEVPVNNEGLASLADVNTYTASRNLKRWERMGVLTKSYGKVLLKSPEKLLSCSSLLAKSSIVRQRNV